MIKTMFFYLNHQSRKRKNAQLHYNTSLPVLFGVKHYADALWEIVKKRDINVNLRTNLVEVKPGTDEAVFENLDKPDERFTVKVRLSRSGACGQATDGRVGEGTIVT